MDLGFTWFDFAALVVLGLSGVMAFARGLIREVFSIIAFIGAAIWVFYNGKKVTADNPWGLPADTLEWTVPSPAPHHTFEVLPDIKAPAHH